MRVRWKDFELPTRVSCDAATAAPTFARFVAEPFERGFGVTVGNGLRRALLSSIEGAAITSVKIKGVSHEFASLPGVVEDVTDIILSIKRIVLRVNSDGPRTLRIDVHRKGEVTAGDIIPDAAIEIVNPEMHICTLSEERDFVAEMEVRRGRGYVTSAENEKAEPEIDRIPIDSAFSPVRRVKYHVENTRVGKLTNYDRLILEVWTNGTITPEMAIVEASKILRTHLNPFVQYFELGKELQINEKKEEEARKREACLEELKGKLAMNVSELDLSVRASNCLTAESIMTIGELVRRSEPELLKVRNFGKTSLREVKKKLGDLGLALGMDLDAIFGESEKGDEGHAA